MKKHLCNKCGCKMETIGKQGCISRRGRWEKTSILECPACHNEWFVITVEALKVPKIPVMEVLSIPFYLMGYQPTTIDETFEWFSDHFNTLENMYKAGLSDEINWDAWMKELIRHLKKIEKGAIKP